MDYLKQLFQTPFLLTVFISLKVVECRLPFHHFFSSLCSCLPKAQQKMIVDVTCNYVFLCSLYPCHSWIFKWVAWAVRDQSEFNLRIIFSWEPSAGLTYMDKVALLVSRGLWGGEDTGRHCAIASIVFLSKISEEDLSNWILTPPLTKQQSTDNK